MAAWQFAEQILVCNHWQPLQWKMKKVRYSPLDKLKSLWASIILGCQHTYEINDKLGGHEQAVAKAAGLPMPLQHHLVKRLKQSWKELECSGGP